MRGAALSRAFHPHCRWLNTGHATTTAHCPPLPATTIQCTRPKTDADIKQGNIEGSPVQDVVGTEYGEAAQQRSSSSGGGGSDSGGNAPAPAGDDTGSITPVENVKGTGRGDQGPQEEMAQAASSGGGASEGQATGGRFDEEPVPGNHPYDPRYQ